MSRNKALKSRDKVTNKMKRDGLIERNAATGEDIRVSNRISDFNIREAKDEQPTYSQVGNRSADSLAPKHSRRRSHINADTDKLSYPQSGENIIYKSNVPDINEPRDISIHDTDTSQMLKQIDNAADTPQTIRQTGNAADIPLSARDIPNDAHKTKQHHAAARRFSQDTVPLNTQDIPQTVPRNANRGIPLDTPKYNNQSAYDGQTDSQNETDIPNTNETRNASIHDVETPQSIRQTGNNGDIPLIKPTRSARYSIENSKSALNRSMARGISTAAYKAKQQRSAARRLSQDTVSANAQDAPQSYPQGENQGNTQNAPSYDTALTEQHSPNANANNAQPITPSSKQSADPRVNIDNRSNLKFSAEKLTGAAASKLKQTQTRVNPTETSAHRTSLEKTSLRTKNRDSKRNQEQNAENNQYAPNRPAESKTEHGKDTDIYETETRADNKTSTDTAADNLIYQPEHTTQTNTAAAAIKSAITAAPQSNVAQNNGKRLQFTPDEAAPGTLTEKSDKKLAKAERQAEKVTAKLKKAQSKIPTKRELKKVSVIDEKSGAVKRKLKFEETVIPQNEHIKGAKPLRPVKAAGNAVIINAHRKVYEVEHENVSVKAAHRGEMIAETVIRAALRRHKTAPYRRVAKLEHSITQKQANLSYQRALAENPKLKSNFLSRAAQKRKIKRDYAKAMRESQKAAQKTAKETKKAGAGIVKLGKAVFTAVKRHPYIAAIIVIVGLLIYILMQLIGAFGGMGTGGLGAILNASYLAEDADIDMAEVAYTEWEVDLQLQIANTETDRPGYDEYIYNIGDISHNPYELMAFLTVMYQNFPYDEIETDLRALFDEQYTLAYTETVEIRYNDPTDANGDGDLEPYEYKILTVTLTARSFSEVALSRLNGEQLPHYALLMETKGARQYVGNPFGDTDWLPFVTSYYGYRIHPVTGAKDLHRGVDIALPAGTQILSAQDGTVTFAGYSGDYGNVIIIENDKGITTKYAHCDNMLVSAGQTVSTGDVIATVGSTGNTTGAHLHFEVLKDGEYLNPLFFADTGNTSATPIPQYGDPGTPMGDGSYAALIAEAEKYLGYPYVFGGSSPASSFDCSGFVCWVLTQSGVKNTGRLTAQGLYNICTPVSPSDARPGDLIFFHSTYSTPNTVTHVGIYVGNGMMIHCGDPIQYTSINTAYWQNHFYAFGRLS